MSVTSRIVAHLDMDCFYVQVERARNPSLLNRPVGVVQYNPFGDLQTLRPDDNREVANDGSLIAVSYEARAKGVTRVMRGIEARKKCPELFLVQVPTANGKADLTIYREAGAKVVQVLSCYGCPIERASIDEVYIDLTKPVQEKLEELSKNDDDNALTKLLEKASISWLAGRDQSELKLSKNSIRNGHAGCSISDSADNEASNAGESDGAALSLQSMFGYGSNLSFAAWSTEDKLLICAAALVADLRALVFDKLKFTCSAGIAHNKMLSKLSSGMHKPNKQTIVPHSRVREIMKSIPISRIQGFGGKISSAVAAIKDPKIECFGDLDRAEVVQAIRTQFGDEMLERFLNTSKGIDFEKVKERALPLSIGCGKSFRWKNALSPQAMKDGTVLHWLKQLGQELLERIENDTDENERKPRNLTVQASVRIAGGAYIPGPGSGYADASTYRSVQGSIFNEVSAATANASLEMSDEEDSAESDIEEVAPVASPNGPSCSSSSSSVVGEATKMQGRPGNRKKQLSKTRAWLAEGKLISISKIGPITSCLSAGPDALAKTALVLLTKALADCSRIDSPHYHISYLALLSSNFEDISCRPKSISHFFVNVRKIPSPKIAEAFAKDAERESMAEASSAISSTVASAIAILGGDKTSGGSKGGIQIYTSESCKRRGSGDDGTRTICEEKNADATSQECPAPLIYRYQGQAIDMDVFKALPPSIQAEIKREMVVIGSATAASASSSVAAGATSKEKVQTPAKKLKTANVCDFFANRQMQSPPGDEQYESLASRGVEVDAGRVRRVDTAKSLSQKLDDRIKDARGIKKFFNK